MQKRYKTPANPFPTTGYYGPEYFCDREKERDQLIQNLTNGQSCLLYGRRRLGKTALIHHIADHLPSDWDFIYIDILSTENEKQFLNSLGTALLHHFSEKDSSGKKVWAFIKNLRPSISFDQLSGLPQVSFQVSDAKQPVIDLISFLEQWERPIIIAIDEFQQIHSYPEKNTDAWLRSVIQRLQNVFFLFSGSQQSILNELFSNPSRPFFKSASPLQLKKIDQEVYANFLVMIFKKHGKNLSPKLANQMLEWAKCHTYYVQLLSNRLFQVSKKVYEQEDWQKCAQQILEENESFFLHFRTLLSGQQWKLLTAIAKSGEVFQPTSKSFLSIYNLGSSATVIKSLQALQEKEMIHQETNLEGTSYYEVNDVFLERWIQGVY
jgi:hypothetical protein